MEEMTDIALGDTVIMLDNNLNEKKTCCCFKVDKWCLKHSGLAGFKTYDKNKNTYCTCFDCCSWCFEFRCKKSFNEMNDITCYFCCCAFYFT